VDRGEKKLNSSGKKYPPRLSVDITDEQQARLKAAIPWGLRQPLFQAIIQEVLEQVEQIGDILIAAVISGNIKVKLKVKNNRRNLEKKT